MTNAGGGDETAPETALPLGERFLDSLLEESHLAAPHELPELVARHAASLGLTEVLIYLVDLQQTVLVPFSGRPAPEGAAGAEVLGVDSTLAGRAYQHLEVLTQDDSADRTRVWLPLVDGVDRIGVLGLTASLSGPLEAEGVLASRLRRLASLVAEMVVTKNLYGDNIVRLRRRAEMSLAAEMQWGLLPPATFACAQLAVAAALEPAYRVAGDSVDYAVDVHCAHLAVFDAMGHGLESARLTALAVSAYRNARRGMRSLEETARAIDGALSTTYREQAFATGIVAELESASGIFRWVNAGHPEPLLMRNGRLVKTLHAKPWLPLGLGETAAEFGIALELGHEQLEPGDLVLLYTDGVVEARSAEGEFFGESRLADLLVRSHAGLPVPETIRRVVRAVLEHQHGQLDDDASLLLFEWRGDDQSSLVAR